MLLRRRVVALYLKRRVYSKTACHAGAAIAYSGEKIARSIKARVSKVASKWKILGMCRMQHGVPFK